MADIARELGVHHKSLGNRVSDERRRRARAADPAAVGEAERDELRRLHKEVAELRMEREILRKAAAHFRPGDDPVSRFRFDSEHRAEFGVKRICRVLEVSRSGFYAWSGRPPSVRTVRDAELAGLIGEAHHRSRRPTAPHASTPSYVASTSVALAAVEAFWATLKRELAWIHQRTTWSTRTELRSALFDDIEAFYNSERIQHRLGHHSPPPPRRSPQSLETPCPPNQGKTSWLCSRSRGGGSVVTRPLDCGTSFLP